MQTLPWGHDQTCVEEHYRSDDLQLGCYRANHRYKVFPKELQVQFESYATFRSPVTLPMPALPMPPKPQAEMAMEYEEEDAEHSFVDFNNLTVIGAINRIVTRSQAKRVRIFFHCQRVWQGVGNSTSKMVKNMHYTLNWSLLTYFSRLILLQNMICSPMFKGYY